MLIKNKLFLLLVLEYLVLNYILDLYVAAKNNTARMLEFERLPQCVKYAISSGIRVNVGHGLDYYNIALISKLSVYYVLHIGHAIISRAMLCGLFSAVQDMKNIIQTQG